MHQRVRALEGSDEPAEASKFGEILNAIPHGRLSQNPIRMHNNVGDTRNAERDLPGPQDAKGVRSEPSEASVKATIALARGLLVAVNSPV